MVSTVYYLIESVLLIDSCLITPFVVKFNLFSWLLFSFGIVSLFLFFTSKELSLSPLSFFLI